LALFDITGFIGFQWVEGGFSADEFLLAVKYMIIPRMNPFPQPNSILVLDNCRIHHTHLDAIRTMLDEIGARYLFLAPYCACDDNPIELGFNALKCSWRRSASTTAHMEVQERIQYCFDTCFENSSVAAVSMYEKCGYF